MNRKNANRSKDKTWLDRYMTLEPKGGVRDVVEQIQNRKVSQNGHSVLLSIR